MKTSKQWIEHFTVNLKQQRINWEQLPQITETEMDRILPSLQAWQLGETSEGAQLIHAASLYGVKTGDADYLDSVKLFIKEEQKHGHNLGLYLDAIHKPRIRQNWGDTLFRRIRHLNTSMEIFTLTVIIVESAAQLFYRALRDATGCPLLKQICTDILIDEAYHIDFQRERMAIIFNSKTPVRKAFARWGYAIFFFSTALVIWLTHKKAFKAGGIGFNKYIRRMKLKYIKTLYRISFTRTRGIVLPMNA